MITKLIVRVWGLGFRVWGSGLWIHGFRFTGDSLKPRVEELQLRVESVGFGFRVKRVGFWVSCLRCMI
jgi:hypothetical protein